MDAARRLVAQGLRPDEIDEDAMAAALYTAGLPDPDMVIRTGGDERLSNFLIWQAAYAEIYFSPMLWPDFGPDASRRGAHRVREPPAPVRAVGRAEGCCAARAQRAAIFVPPLLIVLALGEPWFGALIAVFVAIAAWEAVRLLRGAGYPAIARLVGRRRPGRGRGRGRSLVAGGLRGSARGGRGRRGRQSPRSPRRTPGSGFAAWMATVFGSVYVGHARGAGPARARSRRRSPRPRRRSSSAPSGAGSCS